MDAKSVLSYLFDRLKQPFSPVHKVDDQPYAVRADGTIGDPIRELAPQWDKPTFALKTLSGLAELCNLKVDEFPEHVCLHVVDHLTVELVSLRADEFGRRHVYARAQRVEESGFKFNQFLSVEDFLISFRRCFLFNDEAVKVQQLCSKLDSGMSVTLADDGLSQQLEVKAGTTSKAQVVIPADGISLIPWRTFRDSAPVSSKFFLRFKGVKDGLPIVALYEIDQLWKLDCANAIQTYLRHHAKNIPVVA